MPNQYKFLTTYRQIAKSIASPEAIEDVYFDLRYRLSENPVGNLPEFFKSQKPDMIEMSIAIDAVAHDIHQKGDEILQKIYPGADSAVFKENLDQLSGLEIHSDVRKSNRGYFTNILAEDGFLFLEKQVATLERNQVGMTTKENIKDAIEEYQRLYKAGIASPAEIITLARFFGPESKYQQIAAAQGLDQNEP